MQNIKTSGGHSAQPEEKEIVYTCSKNICTKNETITTNAEIMNPCAIGANPDFASLLKFVLNPIAANDMTIKNLFA